MRKLKQEAKKKQYLEDIKEALKIVRSWASVRLLGSSISILFDVCRNVGDGSWFYRSWLGFFNQPS